MLARKMVAGEGAVLLVSGGPNFTSAPATGETTGRWNERMRLLRQATKEQSGCKAGPQGHVKVRRRALLWPREVTNRSSTYMLL